MLLLWQQFSAQQGQLLPRSGGLGETRPPCALRETATKIMRSFSLGLYLMLTRMGSCRTASLAEEAFPDGVYAFG